MAAPLLADLFERQFRPQCCDAASNAYQTRFRVAIRWLAQAIDAPPRTCDLTPANLDLFAATLAHAGYGRPRILALRRALAALWRFADRLGLSPPYVETSAAPATRLNFSAEIATPLKHWRHGQPIHLPTAAPGTWRHFFATIYQPQRLLTAQKSTLDAYRSMFISFWRWKGRDLAIEETTDELAAAYFAWMLENGRDPRTVNRQRAHWFALWRDAVERKLIAAGPTIRKLPVDRNPPDAWSIEELAALVAATDRLPGVTERHQLPHAQLMRAAILVGFHTAVRRRSLFAIRCRDVDLATGWLTVYGRSVKTRRGRRYRLPRYAIDAIRPLWSEDRELLFPLGAHYAIKLFRQVRELAGLPPSDHRLGYFHKLRRSAATQAAILGGMKQASELLQHSQEYVTQLYIDDSKLPGSEASAKLPQIAAGGGRLDEARELLFAGRPHLAAIAARIVLEQAIEARFRATGKPLERRGLVRQVRSLHGRGVIGRDDRDDILRVVRIANDAAHGRPVEKTAVAELIQVAERVAGGPSDDPLQQRSVS